ncbi:MAG TPA: class I SAM-dependent methyltransferase [Gaiellaceae bacterium]|nr:class I SAM-dependent methyltransferase [Gaiellaceae bacterium]
MIDPACSFDNAAEAYEQARPDYPDALLDSLPLDAAATVLDLGAGTGKLTRVLARRYANVIAVEPLDNMRAILETVVPAAEAHAGTAEAIPLPDTSVDAVFAAAAFHWFSNDDAIAEMARVLRPGGVLALAWNESDKPVPLPQEFTDYQDALADPEEKKRWKRPWSEIVSRGPFGELREDVAKHEQVQSRENVLLFARSLSLVARRPEGERERIMRDLDALLPEGPFVFPMTAHVQWTTRA